jgi:hypothetical protein
VESTLLAGGKSQKKEKKKEIEIRGIQLEERQIQDLQLCTPWTSLVLLYVVLCIYVWERCLTHSDPQIHSLQCGRAQVHGPNLPNFSTYYSIISILSL